MVDAAAGSAAPPAADVRALARREMRRIGVVFAGSVLVLGLLILDVAREPASTSGAPDAVDAQGAGPGTRERLASAASFPPLPDLTSVKDVKARKSRFFSYLLPIVEHRNAWVREARGFLERVRAQLAAGRRLSEPQQRRLQDLASRYRVDLDEPVDRGTIDALLERADEIPPSLVLAQAATESAWGTSRFARSANNLFGEWCYSEGCGLVPKRRPQGAIHEVEQFPSVAASVDSYFRNLNSNSAYEAVRRLRAQARDAGREPTGAELAAGLALYSERGDDYIDEIRAIIRVNDLTPLDEETDTIASAR